MNSKFWEKVAWLKLRGVGTLGQGGRWSPPLTIFANQLSKFQPGGWYAQNITTRNMSDFFYETLQKKDIDRCMFMV